MKKTIKKSRYNYKAEIIRIIDGDTFDVSLDLGFDIWVKTRIRLIRIDAPEKKTDAGKRLTTFLNILFHDGRETYCHVTSKGKFGRWLGEIQFVEKNRTYNLNSYMIMRKFVRKYDGSKRLPWGRRELDIITTRINKAMKGLIDA